jgi:phage baseplate assembly protein gpV
MFNRNDDQFVGGMFTWFTGVVEDINDPKLLNRVKVRSFGFHSQDKGILKTSDLPWAIVIMPPTSASYKGVGSNHELVVGSWVVGFFRDGPSAQDPLIMGSIATQTDGVIDIPEEAQLNPPTNKVHKTEAGHKIEFDNTEGSERINIEHKSGTTININSDGQVTIKASNNQVRILSNTFIEGTLTVTDNTLIQGNTNVNGVAVVDGSITGGNGLSITGNATATGNITTSGEVEANGVKLSTHRHQAQGPTSPTSPPIA